jgi:hypothetical protein
MTRKPTRTDTPSHRPSPVHPRRRAGRGSLGSCQGAALLAAVLVLAGATSWLGGSALAAIPSRAASPAPATSYVPLPVCPRPAPGRAGCLAYQLAPSSQSAAAAGLSPRARARVRERERSDLAASELGSTLAGVAPAAGATPSSARPHPGAEAGQQPQPVTPADLHSAYQLPDEPSAGAPQQTIALVDAYNDPVAEADLKVFDQTFGLPECTAGNGCFGQLNQRGESTNLPFPESKAELEARESTCKTTSAKETLAQRHEREAACFEVAEATGWDVEIATDVEVAHSVCQTCRIRLVEANSAEYPALEAAERTAARPAGEGGAGATEISNSWGGEEPASDGSAFNHPGTVITASAGDNGYLNWTEAETAAAEKRSYYSGADYPASSPRVVAVGGTELTLTTSGTRQSERVWNEDPNPEAGNSGGGGGGCSSVFAPQPWQRAVPDWSTVGCESSGPPRRAVADISADGDPYSGVLVYDSEESEKSLLVIGGTSVASPIIAATFALAGGAGKVEYPAQTLYSHRGSSALYDVTAGGNGRCDALYTGGCSGSMSPLSEFDCGQEATICNAAPGYDGPTGLGTPNGIAAFQAGGSESEQQTEGGGQSEEAGGGGKGAGAPGGEGAAPASPGVGPTGQSSQTSSAGSGSGSTTGEARQRESQTEKPAAKQAGVRLTGLRLTAIALAAIANARHTIAAVALSFRASSATRIRVTLARRVLLHGRMRWVTEPGAFVIAAHSGRGGVRLRGHAALPVGRYRVTLAPAGGIARSVTFVVG